MKNYFVSIIFFLLSVKSHVLAGIKPDFYFLIIYYYEKFIATGEVKCIDEEIPFEIPQGWEWCRISDVCMMQAGKNITADKIFSEQSEVYPYRCVGGNGLRGYVAEFNTEGNHAIVGRQGALCGCLNIETGNFYATEHAVVVSSFGNIHYKFMYWFLMALNLNQLATATAQPGLSVAKVMDSYFPLPPLSEQQRITAKIEELIPIVEKFDKVQTSLDAINNSINDLLKKSILQEAIQGKLVPQITREGTAQELLEQIKQEKYRLVKEGKLKRSALTDSVIYKGDDNKYYEMVGGKNICIDDEILFEIPDSWVWCRLGFLFNHNTGKALNASNKEGSMLPYITTSNLYWGQFDLSSVRQMYFKDSEIEKCSVSNGDLLVCEGGDIGRAAIWPYDTPMCIQNHIHKLRSYNQLDTLFYYYIFQAYKYNGYIGGKGIGIQGLSSKALHNMLVPLPPINEQIRITSKISSLFQFI